jgi:hypothetical protein
MFRLLTNCRLLKDKVFPSDNVLPNNYEWVNVLLKRLGIEYISFHIYLNDCIFTEANT